MSKQTGYLLIVLGVALLLFFYVPVLDTGSAGDALIGFILKGSRVGPSTSDSVINGNEIDVDPSELASAAGYDLDTYTLGRVISSEEGNAPNAYQVAVAWASKNNAQDTGSSIFEWSTDGSYGRQGAGRPVSTFLDPYEGHITIAQLVISGNVPDPTDGARYFIAPRAQNSLHNSDPDTYKSFDEVNQSRLDSGLVAVDVDGVDPSLLVFYKQG